MEAGTLVPLHFSWIDVLARFGAALALSMVLGLERFFRRKPIDFRPFAIIALASCALSIAIIELALRSHDANLSIDPGKVISGIMSGIGFLGAGALFRDDNVVHGAGSASAIWASGAIGISCGLGFLWLGAALALGVFAVLLGSRPFTSAYSDSLPIDDEGDDVG